MQRFWIVSLLFVFSDAFPYPDRDARGNYTENFTHLQLSFRISMERMQYREGEDIPLEFHVHNNGKEVVRIFPSLDGKQTFQLQIRDDRNRLVPMLSTLQSIPFQEKYERDPIQSSRNHIENLRGDHSKEIALAPGERFSYRILLQETYELRPGTTYTVVGYFYPNATEKRKNSLLGGTDSEGRLVFMRSENTKKFFYEPRREKKESSDLEPITQGAEGLSPEETVFLFLAAEMKKNWGHYFKWVYIQDFILAYDRFSGVYINAEEKERELILDEFKKYLTTLPSGKLKSFRIVGVENLSSREAKVKVFAERLEERIPSKYEYEYNLKKDPGLRNSLWKIHSVVARVRK